MEKNKMHRWRFDFGWNINTYETGKNYNKKIMKKIEKKCWQMSNKMVIYERTTQEDITSWNKKNYVSNERSKPKY